MSNLSEYVKRATSGKSELTEVMERRKSAKAQELENLEFDALIAEAKKKLQDASPNKIDSSQATNFATMMFAGRTPAEIKEIIHSLTQEEIDKFAYMSARMDPNNFANMRGLMQTPSTGTKEIVEAIKIGTDLRKPESNSNNIITAKDLLDAIKTGMEITKAQQPANSQNDPQFILLKESIAESKAAREENARQREEMAKQNQLRLEKDIADLKSRPSEVDVLLSYEEKAEKFRKARGGTDSAVINEWALKKLDMEQNKDIADKNLDWEKEKYTKEQEGGQKQMDMAKTFIEGPLGKVIEAIGNAGADRIRGNKASPNGQAQSPQIGQVKCPNCAGTFPANTQLPTIQCPLCGVQLQSGNQPVAPQETVVPQEQPAPVSAQQSPEVKPVAEPADKQ